MVPKPFGCHSLIGRITRTPIADSWFESLLIGIFSIQIHLGQPHRVHNFYGARPTYDCGACFDTRSIRSHSRSRDVAKVR